MCNEILGACPYNCFFFFFLTVISSHMCVIKVLTGLDLS